MQNIITAIKLALDAFRTHKVRTSLAVLGVTIGIASIIIVFSAGEGIKSLLTDQVESFGADVIQVEIKVPTSKTGLEGERQNAINLLQGAQVTTLSLDDLDDILEIPNIRDGYGLLMTQESVGYRSEVRRSFIWASGSAFIDIDQAQVAEGRFFTASEDKSLAQVALLGSGIKEKLFGESDPIGRTIKIRDTRFEVIGVMKERGSIFSFNFDDFVYVPVRTMQKRIMGAEFLHNIMVEVQDVERIDDTAEEMRQTLRANHDIIITGDDKRENFFDTGKDDFRVTSMVEALDVFDDIFFVFTIILLAIVAISLVVGGVGVMNVMYVIVGERTPEIGLRKAVGAKYGDIMTQFLVESAMVTLAGGLVGTVLGVLVSLAVAIGAQSSGLAWSFRVPIEAFVISFLFSVIFGILFGIYPSRRAALLEPIEALQSGR
jgi:putative ABC transport system permease protein